jgi:uncharacterized iron-regulated protein
MSIGEKNQAMKSIKMWLMNDRLSKWRRYSLFSLVLTVILWGCTVTPTQKLYVKDISEPFEEGTIISARLGEPVSLQDLLKDLEDSRVTYVGEKHTNTEHHRIQLQIIEAAFKNNSNLVVGMEMFDHTYQDVLDLWSKGKLTQKDFLRKSHWYANWRYEYSLYRDILEFIKEHNIRLVGLNIPNHIPPKIREGGIENLSDEDKAHLPREVDTSKSAHRDYLQKIFKGHKHHFKREVEFEDFYAAQSVWEDAMAEMIAKSLNDGVMVVLAGNGHIQFKYGIPERAYKQTGASFRTIYLAPVGSEVERNIADYVWVTQQD